MYASKLLEALLALIDIDIERHQHAIERALSLAEITVDAACQQVVLSVLTASHDGHNVVNVEDNLRRVPPAVLTDKLVALEDFESQFFA